MPKFGASTRNWSRGGFDKHAASDRLNLVHAPRTWVTVDMHSVPYSEHSSYDELIAFLGLFSPREQGCTKTFCATPGVSSTQTDSSMSVLTLTKCSQTYSPLVVGTVRGKNWRQGNNSSTPAPSHISSHYSPTVSTSSYDLFCHLVHISLPDSIVD